MMGSCDSCPKYLDCMHYGIPRDCPLEFSPSNLLDCDYCDGAKPLVIGDTNDKGIAVHNTGKLVAYGYNIHGGGSNGLTVQICFCPMCGKRLAR